MFPIAASRRLQSFNPALHSKAAPIYRMSAVLGRNFPIGCVILNHGLSHVLQPRTLKFNTLILVCRGSANHSLLMQSKLRFAPKLEVASGLEWLRGCIPSCSPQRKGGIKIDVNKLVKLEQVKEAVWGRKMEQQACLVLSASSEKLFLYISALAQNKTTKSYSYTKSSGARLINLTTFKSLKLKSFVLQSLKELISCYSSSSS